MSSSHQLSDDFVAQVLAQEATDSVRKFRTHGFSEVLPQRPTNNAPKPNTRFLRHVIEETDSHNAALRAKEAKERRSKHDLLERRTEDGRRRWAGTPNQDVRQSRRHGRLSPDDRGQSRSPARSQKSSKDIHTRSKDVETSSTLVISNEEERAQAPTRSPRRYRHDRERRRESHRERRHRPSRSRSRSPKRSRPSERRDRSRRRSGHSRGRRRALQKDESSRSETVVQRLAFSAEHEHFERDETSSDSDPLDSIVGPMLPPEPEIRSRGRGAPHASKSGIDAHFAANYDPTADIEPEMDGVRDDWDQALEALRDRQKWRERRADRLRAAGFTAEEVSQWASNQNRPSAVEKDEGDVKWRSQGEGREWDRGKVSTSDGEITTEPTWGRLKNA